MSRHSLKAFVSGYGFDKICLNPLTPMHKQCISDPYMLWISLLRLTVECTKKLYVPSTVLRD